MILKKIYLFLIIILLFATVGSASAAELRLAEITPDETGRWTIRFDVYDTEGNVIDSFSAVTREAVAGKADTLTLYVPETGYELTDGAGETLWVMPRYNFYGRYAFHADDGFAEMIAELDPEAYYPDGGTHTVNSLGFEVPEAEISEDEIRFALRNRADYIHELVGPAYLESSPSCVAEIRIANGALVAGGGCGNDPEVLQGEDVRYSVNEATFVFTSDIYGKFTAADVAAVTMRWKNPLVSLMVRDEETGDPKGTVFAELPEIVLTIPVR